MMAANRSTSDIWYHFTKLADGKAKCRYCRAALSMSSGSTGNLKRHLTKKHPTVPLSRVEPSRSRSPSACGESVDDPAAPASAPLPSPSSTRSLSQLSDYSNVSESGLMSPVSTSTASSTPFSTPGPRSNLLSQSLLTRYVDAVKPVSAQKKRMIDVQLLKMICKEYHPFSLVEDKEFRKLVNILNPNYSLPSRKTLTNSLLPAIHSELLDKIKLALLDAPAVCLTCDAWTNINNVSFYALTAHYIDQTTCLRSCLIECSEFSNRHTSRNIAAWVNEVLERFAIRNKICAVITDNAANMKAAVTELTLRHLGCFAHTLNLVVTDAISASIGAKLDKAKSIVQYFKRSSSALAKLREMQTSLNKDQLKLKQDVPTRWNSTFDMLERLMKNKEPLVSTLALLGYKDKLEELEWTELAHAVKVLTVFNDVTTEISAEANVSLSKTTVLSRIMTRKVKQYLETNRDAPETIVKLANELIDGLTRRFGNRESNELISQSIFLDPRFKSQGFGDDAKFKSTKKALVLMVKATIQSTEPGSSNEPETPVQTSSVWDEFDASLSSLQEKQDPTAQAVVEIDKYLNEQYLNRINDPLKWWESRKLTYPNLYAVAIKRLCIPATSVPCERIFSKAGQICTEKRSRLTSDKVSKTLFINHNIHLM